MRVGCIRGGTRDTEYSTRVTGRGTGVYSRNSTSSTIKMMRWVIIEGNGVRMVGRAGTGSAQENLSRVFFQVRLRPMFPV